MVLLLVAGGLALVLPEQTEGLGVAPLAAEDERHVAAAGPNVGQLQTVAERPGEGRGIEAVGLVVMALLLTDDGAGDVDVVVVFG